MVLKFYIFLPIYFPPTPSASTSAPSISHSSFSSDAAHTPSRSNPSCYHQLFATLVPGLRTAFSQRNIISNIAMYCMVVFFLLEAYAFHLL